NMLSLQHAQQLRQSAGVKPAPDFDSAVARQCHRQTALPRRAGARHLHRQPTAPGYWTALHVPLPIAGQRGQAQPLLPAELNLTHAAGFVFGHQPLGFRATPTSLDFHYLRFFVHPSTASPMPAREQMGCSDAYLRTVPGIPLARRAPAPSGTRTPRRLPVCRIARSRPDGSGPSHRASAHLPSFHRPECNSRRIAAAMGMSNSPTRITHPSSVARLISMPASRSRITLWRYSGRGSLYFAITRFVT